MHEGGREHVIFMYATDILSSLCQCYSNVLICFRIYKRNWHKSISNMCHSDCIIHCNLMDGYLGHDIQFKLSPCEEINMIEVVLGPQFTFSMMLSFGISAAELFKQFDQIVKDFFFMGQEETQN